MTDGDADPRFHRAERELLARLEYAGIPLPDDVEHDVDRGVLVVFWGALDGMAFTIGVRDLLDLAGIEVTS